MGVSVREAGDYVAIFCNKVGTACMAVATESSLANAVQRILANVETGREPAPWQPAKSKLYLDKRAY